MKEIPLTQGKVAFVDDEDYERVMQHKWCAHKINGVYYASRSLHNLNGSRAIEYLHCFILGVKGVDHRDGDTLNNRRENLRRATKLQNNRGKKRKAAGASSPYRGVCWDSQREKWMAKIRFEGKTLNLGRFTVAVEAARTYDVEAIKLFGEFAAPNFPVMCRGTTNNKREK